MDHDENDFQSQNFQLVGEDNKFPPSLRSYALPKFDFDEHLQVHLRYDSLVDRDILLDIQGDDNNWIEDFSSGTSAVEFSSTAADSRSISMHNNVWFEATSSESVDTLLKSSREDEMNDKKAITMEAEGQNASSAMTDQMDPTLRQGNDDNNSTMGGIIQDDSSVSPNNQRNLLEQYNDASGAWAQVEGMPQIFDGEISDAELNSGSLDVKVGVGQGTRDEHATVPLDDTDTKCSVASETLCGMVQNNEPSLVSFRTVVTGRENLNTSVLSEQVAEEHNAISLAERSDLLSYEVLRGRSQMLSDAKGNVQFLDGHAAETPVCGGDSPSFLAPTGDSSVLINEGCDVTGFSENPDGLLQSIPYQVKTWKNDSKAIDESSTQPVEINSMEVNGEKSIETDLVDISKENISNQLIKQNDRGLGITSETSVVVNASVHVYSKTQVEEPKDENSAESSHSFSGFRSPKPSFVEKSVEDAESGRNLTASENILLGQSPLCDLLDKAEVKVLSFVPDKLPTAAEPSYAYTSSLAVSAAEECAGPSISSGTTDSNSEVVTGKAESVISAGQMSEVVRDTSGLAQRKKLDDGSVATDLTVMGVGEQKETTSCKLLAPDSFGSDEEVKATGGTYVSVVNSVLDACLPVELVRISDPVDADCSSHMGMALDAPVDGKVSAVDTTVKFPQSQDTYVDPEQKEGARSSRCSPEFIQSDEKEHTIAAKCSSTKLEPNVGDRTLSNSDAGEDGPHNATKKPQSTMEGQPSSYVGSSASHSEFQSLANKQMTHEEAVLAEGSLLILDSAVQGKDDSNKLKASSHENKETTIGVSVELPRHGEEQMLPETNPSFEINPDAPVYSGMNTPTTLSGNNAEVPLSAVESGKASLYEPSCGSPTVISCSGHSLVEPEGGNAEKSNSITTLDSKENIASEDDKSFTFVVGRVKELSENDGSNQWKPFPSVQSSELPKISDENPKGSHLEAEGKQYGVKIYNQDKNGHATRSSSEKQTPKGKAAKGTSTRKKSIDSVGKSGTSSAHVGTVSSGMQMEELQPYTDGSRMKTPGSPIAQTSSLPDLNSSSSATPFHQPFTDLQQLQLRAQIFVYGSIIQNIPPDESCMQSAFGETDGGRSFWETVWRKSVERYQNQKSPVNSETPMHAHSVVIAPEQVKQNKVASTSASRSVGKAIAPAGLNSTPPLPSPLWSISTHDGLHSNIPGGAQLNFNQALSPLHSYPSAQTRQFANNSTPWRPQSPRPGPWAVSIQSPALNTAMQYSAPVVETVQVTPVRDSSISYTASTQLMSPSSLHPTLSSAGVTPASVIHVESQRETSALANNKNVPSVQKSRKRKKAAVIDDLAKTSTVSQSISEPSLGTAVTKSLPSASPIFSLLANTPTQVSSKPIVSASTIISPSQYKIMGTGNTEQRAIFSEETGNKIEQAKLQAEDAAAAAASVVSHSQDIWNQLAAQRNSGLVTEVEEKLASAAAAVAAAASVAKAAAAAAKVASNAALQAKMMADEALESAKTGLTQSSEAAFDAGKNLVRLTPGSILKGKDQIHGSSSIISTAREAAKRRVEAASAAAKRAENLDAIMKAAELAAEAVSQVGTIIAMGDPLPFKLSELVEAGPEGSWKAYRPTSEKPNKEHELLRDEQKDLNHRDHHHEQTPSNNKKIQRTAAEDAVLHDGEPVQSEDNCGGLGGGSGVATSDDSQKKDNSFSNLKDNAIQKGSLVEVTSDEDGLRGGWFSAHVLDVKDNKAHVSYKNLLSEDGSGQLKEWISLESEIKGAPRIRIAHPMIVTKYDGTRKRRREAVGNHAWSKGDHVDAWMRDGWWEGIVIEKSQVDDTKHTVNFPAGGDSSLVQGWDLRPSLTWKDGQWIEWSHTRENTLTSYEGDTPQEKRQKLGRGEAKADESLIGQGGPSKKMPPEDSGKTELSRPLNLSSKDTIFTVGKNAREENISDAQKAKRTGLQKEGSRVVFGVPKPGKKRKFMEVSKHYVSDKTDKTSQGNDCLKFPKYLMPQASRSWRNTSKVDPKAKRAGDSKPVGVRNVKAQTTRTRSRSEKVNPSDASISSSNGEKNGQGFSVNIGAGLSNQENNFGKKPVEVISFPSSLATTESLVAVSSSVQPLSTAPAHKKKSSSVVEAGIGLKGGATPALDKSIRIEKEPSENHGKSITDAIEPRRSNRKIQPTSRLLEGLQSSLIISKIPAFSHDKGSKALHRSSSSRGNSRG